MFHKPVALSSLVLAFFAGFVPFSRAQAPVENPPFTWGPGIKVLIISGGGWHDFDRWFGQADTATLKEAGITSVHFTKNATNAAAELPNADVALLSVNSIGFDTPAYRKALFDHIAAGKGVVVLHSGAWHNWVWPEYDLDVVGGNYSSHDGKAPFTEHVLKQHPVTAGLPESFPVNDERYHAVADPAGPGVDVLIEGVRGPSKLASVWIVHNPKARIVCIALGHDGDTHNSPNFKKLLTNAVTWPPASDKMPVIWRQHYNPLGHWLLSTLVAGLPVAVLLGSIAFWRVRIHLAATAGLLLAWLIAVAVYQMPAGAAAAAAVFGGAYGLFPIGWIILNLIFLYDLTVEKGAFSILRGSLARLAPDPRVQVILIAFSFGAFFEGAAGFGTPVAITSAILIQLGFRPLMASGLSLIANTAPVAFGALGTPVVALTGVTGIDILKLSAMIGAQLLLFSFLIPFWVVWAMAGWRGMIEVWPAAFVAGASFALPQFFIARFDGPWLPDIVASVCSIVATVLLLKFWRPRAIWKLEDPPPAAAEKACSRSDMLRAWAPWLILTLFIFVWGLPKVRNVLGSGATSEWRVPFLNERVARGIEVAPAGSPPEKAVYKVEWLAATGTGILFAAIGAGLLMGFAPRELARLYLKTVRRLRYSLWTIAAMLSLGYVTRYSGADATLGLALARAGPFYPFCGTLLGWLGVALTGSDTASNVLFGSLQTITAKQLGINPVLMAAANSSGGVMGKMVDAQSIVVASTATNWYGHEGKILRYVAFHSLALAALMGALVTLQAL